MRAIVGGTSLLDSSIFTSWDKQNIQTPYGDVSIKRAGDHLFLQRHGPTRLPPHVINHQANIWGLKSIGVTSIVAINSVGSMKITIKPRSFVVPDDFIAPWVVPTFFNSDMRFTIPLLDEQLRGMLLTLCRQTDVTVTNGGVYVQTIGPRFETRAEINLFRKHAHIVGMTLASEATLAAECGIPYASLCSVDNYANGLARKPLTLEQVGNNVKLNQDAIELLIRKLLEKEI